MSVFLGIMLLRHTAQRLVEVWMSCRNPEHDMSMYCVVWALGKDHLYSSRLRHAMIMLTDASCRADNMSTLVVNTEVVSGPCPSLSCTDESAHALICRKSHCSNHRSIRTATQTCPANRAGLLRNPGRRMTHPGGAHSRECHLLGGGIAIARSGLSAPSNKWTYPSEICLDEACKCELVEDLVQISA